MDLGWFEVALNVQDIERSLAFYRKLGFRLVDGAAESRFATLQNGDCRLSLYQGFLDPPQTQLIFWQGDVRAIAEDLTGKDLAFDRPPATHDDGGTGALLRDPDGHPIYFVNMPGVTRNEAGEAP
jgi:catechol 2,3-dioxygenase-like lactoylglutathione lyase family enzyme